MTETMGARVKRRREEIKLTQGQLAELVGCSQPMIRKIEAGSRTSLGRKLAVALRTSLEWLETGDEGSASTQQRPSLDEPHELQPYIELAHHAAHDLILRDVLDKLIEGGEKAVTVAWTALLLAEDNEKSGRAKPTAGHKKAAAGGKK